MKWLASALVILACGTATVARAQYNVLLYLPLNARSVGMGYAGVADNSNPATIYFNPANVVATPRAYIDATRQSFDNEVFNDDFWAWRAAAGASVKVNASSAWTFGANLGYARLNSAALFYDGGETIWSLTLGGGYSADGRSKIRFGATAKRLGAKVPTGFDDYFNLVTHDEHGFAYDFGAAIDLAAGSEDEWNVISRLGFSALDHGPGLESANDLPTRAVIGTSFLFASPLEQVGSARVPLFAGTLDFDADIPDRGSNQYALGMEAAVAQILFGRAGVTFLPDSGFSDDSVTAWGVGLGFPVDSFRFRLDYGKQEEDFLDGAVLSLLVLKEL